MIALPKSIKPLTKRQKRFAISIAATVVATIPALYALSNRTPNEQIFEAPVAVPTAPQINPAWSGNSSFCADRQIQRCYEQIRLRLEKDLDIAIAMETKRYLAQASTLPTHPTSEACYRKSEQMCMTSFLDNVVAQLGEAKTQQDRIKALGAAIALVDAQVGVTKPTPIAPNTFESQANLVNWQNQIKLFFGMSEAPAINSLVNTPRIVYTETLPEPAKNGGEMP